MARKTIITRKALHDLIRETIVSPGPVKTNSTVDPSAAETDPNHPDYHPSDRRELNVAVSNVLKGVPDQVAGQVYDAVKKAAKDGDESGETMKAKQKQDTVEEALIRRAVRKMLIEASGGLSYSGYGVYPGHGAEFDDADDEDPDPRKQNRSVVDVGGAPLQNVAKTTGLSVAGAKRAEREALAKFKYLTPAFNIDPTDVGLPSEVEGLSPEDYSLVTLYALNDFIQFLDTSGELTSEDVELLKNNPKIVGELEGFAAYFDDVIDELYKHDRAGKPIEDFFSNFSRYANKARKANLGAEVESADLGSEDAVENAVETEEAEESSDSEGPRCPEHVDAELTPKKKGWYCPECDDVVVTFDEHPQA